MTKLLYSLADRSHSSGINTLKKDFTIKPFEYDYAIFFILYPDLLAKLTTTINLVLIRIVF
jgi:hypothetical protein